MRLRCAGFFHGNTLQQPKTQSSTYKSSFLLCTDFFLLSSDILCVCMCVNMFLRMCSMIACVRLQFQISGGGGNSMIRYVTQGRGMLKSYASLHRGRGSRMTKISVTYFFGRPLITFNLTQFQKILPNCVTPVTSSRLKQYNF